MQKVPGFLRLLVVSFALASCSERAPDPGTNASGAALLNPNASTEAKRDFLESAAENAQLEVHAAQLAAQKAQSREVKLFADMMYRAYSRVNDSLIQIAHANDVELPATPGKDGQEILEKLRGLDGADFDEKYSQEMLKAHKEALSTFEEAARSAPDPDIQIFAQSQLPALRDHLRIAQTLPGTEQG